MDSIPSNEQDTSPSLTRRKREKLAHRQEIIDAAIRVFAQKGFFNATLDEIAQEAEFSKGALYLYFSSKEDLLFSIIKEKFEPMSNRLKEVFDVTMSFKEKLHSLFSDLAVMVFKEKDFFSIIISQQVAFFQALSIEKADKCFALHLEFDNLLVTHITKAIENGELRDINPHAINGVIHGATENMMFNYWNCKTVEELLTAVDAFIDILYNGIALEKEA